MSTPECVTKESDGAILPAENLNLREEIALYKKYGKTKEEKYG